MVVTAYLPVLLTVLICIYARPIGERLGVIDSPDDDRRIHHEPTPLVGGIAIMLPLAVWCAIRIVSRSVPLDGLELAILLSGGGVAVTGFMDDQRMNSAGGRLILLAIFSLVALKLDPGLFVHRLNTAAWASIPLSTGLSTLLVVAALMGFSSAVNMVDGANGLVLSFVCIWCSCEALAGGATADPAELVAVAAFVTLLFNARGRLFLGDCGAFAVAFTVGLIAIEAHNQNRVMLETAAAWFLLPVLDCLRLIPLRLLRGRSPFRPDKRHFHHRLAARVGEMRAVLIYVGIVGASSLAATLFPRLSIVCIIGELVPYAGFLAIDALIPSAGAGERANPRNVVKLRDTRRGA